MASRFIIFALLALFGMVPLRPLHSADLDEDSRAKRDKILGHMISMQLRHYHINHQERKIDDTLSNDAFELYLKRIDPQKRSLLRSDVEILEQDRHKIDDEIESGNYRLPFIASDLLARNLEVIHELCDDILDKGFEYDVDESVEFDVKKLDFCSDMKELKERWSKTLKFQCMTNYLRLLKREETLNEIESKKEVSPAIVHSTSAGISEAPVASGNAQLSGNTLAEVRKPRTPEALRTEAREQVRKNIDDYFKRLKEEKHEDKMSAYFNSITACFDPHTNYMDPIQNEDFNIHMRKSLEGIGAELRETEEGFTKVVRIVPGSASALQGELEAGDLIVKVAQADTEEEIDITGMRIREVVQHIRGPKGTTVLLTVRKSDGRVKTIPIVRDVVQLDQQLARSTVIHDEVSGKNFGYLFLPDFYRNFDDPSQRSATSDVEQELKKMKKQSIEGLIFDLRNNGGGALEDAKFIAGLFIEWGPIVQIKDSTGNVKILLDKDRNIAYDGPLLVMVNQYSASASEIFAAAMQDYKRALVVGTGHTHGKGTVQTLIKLNSMAPANYAHFDFGSLKVTVQKFYRINGQSTQYEGVIPDILLPDDRSALETGERFLEHSLAWDKIRPARYKEWETPVDHLEVLKGLSEKRVGENEVFKFIRRRDGRLLEKKEQTLVSLKMENVRREMEAARLEDEEYEKILKDRHPKSETEEDGEDDEDSDRSMVDDTEAAGKPQDEAFEQWVKNVKKDPYILEGLSILNDMVAGRKS